MPGAVAPPWSHHWLPVAPCDRMKQGKKEVLSASLDKLYFIMLFLTSLRQQVTCMRVCVLGFSKQRRPWFPWYLPEDLGCCSVLWLFLCPFLDSSSPKQLLIFWMCVCLPVAECHRGYWLWGRPLGCVMDSEGAPLLPESPSAVLVATRLGCFCVDTEDHWKRRKSEIQ